MRKALGLLFATSLLIPVGITVASSAGGAAAAKGPTCKGLTSTLSGAPRLPKIGDKTIVTSNQKIVGTITGCTGGPVKGVTSATILSTYKYKGNCTTLLTGKGGVSIPAKPLGTFTWSNHKTSKVSLTTTIIGSASANPLKLKIVSKIVSGQYAGAISTGTVTGKSAKGSCVTIPGASLVISGSGSFTFK